jgi:putative hydrolase of the HAD superfamily
MHSLTIQSNTPSKHVRAILFDLVGVLVFLKDGYIPKTKNERNAADIENLFNHVDDGKLIADIKSTFHLRDEEIAAALPCIPAKFEIYNKLWKILPDLKHKFKLGIINNGNALALKYWHQRFNFSEFDIFINSAQVTLMKPNPEIFALACKKLHVSPDECLFMDDSLQNIESASTMDMSTIWWNSGNGREKNLKSFTDFLSLHS